VSLRAVTSGRRCYLLLISKSRLLPEGRLSCFRSLCPSCTHVHRPPADRPLVDLCYSPLPQPP
jgi:hypothetical protein